MNKVTTNFICLLKSPKSVPIKIILAVFFIAFVFETKAQRTRSVELKPIHVQGRAYYYDYKKIDGGPHGVQIPLQSLGDDEINRRYKSFRTLMIVQRSLSLIPAIYLYSNITNNSFISRNEFWQVFGGTLVAQLTCTLIAKRQLRKGIDRYNRLILEPGARAPGLTITFKF